MLQVADSDYTRYEAGDSYTLTGVTTFNGIPNTEINTTHIIRTIGVGTLGIIVSSNASSSGSGGGNAVVRSDGLIRVTDAAHGQVNGDRVKITGAANTGGILAAEINLEFIIRNVAPNTFDVMTEGTSTSSVTGGGGAGTQYYKQIEAGNIDQLSSQGYGAGLYGVGLYGTALVSPTGETYPRIWFMDRFGEDILMTAGGNTAAYAWSSDTSIAPTVIPNAPTDINYLFVSDNILVTFGHDVENKIFASDQGDYTIWTASSTNQVFEDIIEGAGRLLSHAPVDGYNLIFTEQTTYTFRYIGGLLVWNIEILDSAIGIIAPMARASVNGTAYWMGQENFYMFRGGKIEVMPSNFTTECSALRYVFDDLNYSQRYKIFAWYNEKFDEIWFHYPSASSNECNRVVRYSRKLQCWVIDTMNRTAGEYPVQSLSNPRLANLSVLYNHETGTDDDGAPMLWYAKTKKFIAGKDTAVNTALIPDNTMTGAASILTQFWNYPQSQTAMNSMTYPFTGSTEKIEIQMNGRYWDYTFSGEELGQSYLMGRWYDEPQKGATAP